MIELFEFTEDQLIEAFMVYNAEFLQNPGDFGDLTPDVETATSQAKKIISILQEIQKRP